MNEKTITLIFQTLEILLSFFEIGYLLVILKKKDKPMLAVFFLFAIASFLLSDLYWLFYDLIRGAERMPFAANEFGEAAGFLLFSSVLNTAFKRKKGEKEPVVWVLLTLLFACLSVVLWCIWSGEWTDDVMIGIVYVYFLCNCTRALLRSGATKRYERIGLVCLAFSLIALQFVILFAPETASAALNLVCYLIMCVTGALFLIRFLRAIRTKQSGKILLSLSFSLFAWMVSSMYMSEGYWYLLFFLASSLSRLAMLYAIRKETYA